MNRRLAVVRSVNLGNLTVSLFMLIALLSIAIGTLQAQEIVPLPVGNQGEAGLPTEPEPYSPFDGVISNNIKPTFRWTKSTGATKYLVRLKDLATGDSKKGSLPSGNCTSACAYTFDTNLVDGHSYSWQVEAVNTSGSTMSDQFTLVVDHPGVPSLLSPLSGSQVTSPAVQLTWTSINEAAQYVIKMKDLTSGDKALKKTVSASICGGSCVYTLKSDEQTAIVNNHEYSWKITAKNTNGSSKSGKYTFKAKFTS